MLHSIEKDDVIKAERNWTEAHRNLNLNQLSELMHPDYAIITPKGEILNKEDALDSYRSGGRHWEYAESGDYMIRIYGLTAIVIGTWRARGVNNDVYFDYSAKYTSVWLKDECGLRMVSDQSTPFS